MGAHFDAKAFMARDNTMNRIHAALNHAVRSQAENPLLHMARVLRSERRVQLAAESRARERAEAEAAAQRSGDGEAAGESERDALHPVVPQTVQELEAVLREARGQRRKCPWKAQEEALLGCTGKDREIIDPLS